MKTDLSLKKLIYSKDIFLPSNIYVIISLFLNSINDYLIKKKKIKKILKTSATE